MVKYLTKTRVSKYYYIFVYSIKPFNHTMGILHKYYLEGDDIYQCIDCGSHLTTSKELVSTSFRGRTGVAWLFSRVVNVSEGPFEERMMITGQHTIVDIYCNDCGANLGWKYEEATEESQKYKKGKFILEKALLKNNNPNYSSSVEEDNDPADE